MYLNNRPIIGVILDEDTSKGGRFYQTGKGYFKALDAVGLVAIGLPYAKSSIEFAKQHCAGLLSTGANIKFPKDYYIEGEDSIAPYSDRFDIEKELIEMFLDLDRPFLGICNGMQLLGAISGMKMTFQIMAHNGGLIDHNTSNTRHDVDVYENTKLFDAMGTNKIITNSYHSEGLLQEAPNIKISARSKDNVIEAIERTDKNFALGVQWHPETLWPAPNNPEDLKLGHYSEALFKSFAHYCEAPANN